MNKSAEQSKTSAGKLEAAHHESNRSCYHLKLYLTGSTPRSTRALANILEICQVNLQGKYELEVFDLYQEPERASQSQIIAAPTLIKDLPLPRKRIIGDLSNTEKVMTELNLQPPPNAT